MHEKDGSALLVGCDHCSKKWPYRKHFASSVHTTASENDAKGRYRLRKGERRKDDVADVQSPGTENPASFAHNCTCVTSANTKTGEWEFTHSTQQRVECYPYLMQVIGSQVGFTLTCTCRRRAGVE